MTLVVMGAMGDAGAIDGTAQIRQLLDRLPSCFDGATAVQFLNSAASTPPPADPPAGASSYVRQHIMDAVNSPKSIGIEIPFWPWSTAPTYCEDSPQHAAVRTLIESLLPEKVIDINNQVLANAPELRAWDMLERPLSAFWAQLGKYGKYAVIGGTAVVAIYGLSQVATIAKAVRG